MTDDGTVHVIIYSVYLILSAISEFRLTVDEIRREIHFGWTST
jgi:hypothetical protein